jgi:hypothetical protein
MPDAQPGIVDALQKTVQLHLSQAEAYEGQAAHFARWGYPVLADEYSDYADEERKHLMLAINRLEFFDVQPDVAHEVTVWPREDFEGILDSNYAGVVEAAAAERDGFMRAIAVGDPTTAKLFAKLLRGSEDGMNTVEAIRSVIATIGLDNFLANKASGGAG